MRAKLLLLLFLLHFSLYAQTNLVLNGNFETWSSSSQPDNWNRYLSGLVSQSSIAQNGTSSTNMMVASDTFNYINSDFFPVTANKTYRVTLYHRMVKGTFSSIDLSLYHKPGTFKEEIIKTSDVTFSTTEWKKIEFEYTPTVTENIEIDIWTTGSLNSEILIDNVSVIDVAEAPAQYTLIPDVNFEKKLISLGIDTGLPDGKVLTETIASQTDLNLSRSSINDLTGIEDFVSLKFLDFSYNDVTSVNLSKNTNLITLNCSTILPAGLDVLDLSNNTLLKELYCSGNNMTTLDLSKNTLLTNLICNRSQVLLSINLKNGNNKNMDLNKISFPIPSLKCIQVDDVIYSNANWSSLKLPTTTFSLDCNTLGLEDSVFDKVAIYPNPTRGEVSINNITLDKVNVYNELGQLVKTFSLNSADINNTINLCGLPRGIYYIYLINQDAASAKKIIVE
ncbi:T9SS type A sorting domain-containing protein [Flavobacterium sp. N2038]|uniref:T9SS type A sorting domain-containing protein n=1 Tax=Flavobacterium sp. N2038 TaxID=2986829 RepID=UPI002224E2A8|nr:T9SS type A sorting domain-containing protein [Flavobacterium sp. N2038]